MTDRVETNEFRVEKLDNDYATWAVLFQVSLEDKELWEAILEPQPDAETDPTGAVEWYKKDRRALGRLKMSVALHHLPTDQACTSAKMAWDALEGVFTAKVNARRLQLAQDFALLKMNPGETLLGYSGRTRKLQLEMMATSHPYDDNTVIIHFLNGLPDAYEMEKTMLINLRAGAALQWDDVMPTLYPVENEVKEEAAKKEGPAVGAYAASAPGRSGSGMWSGPPTWPRDVPMPREERQKRVVCWTCGVRGHFMSALCDATEMGFATPLKRKPDAGQALRDWVKHLELQTGHKVRIIRCDGAGELVKSADMVSWFKETGIKAETTAPYNPQMNGKA